MGQNPSEELKSVLHPNVIRANEREAKGLNDVFEMFKEDTDRDQWPFTGGCDVLDDLHLWSQKINILGFVISELAEKEAENGDHSFHHFGYVLGDIVQEYSRAINCVVNSEKFRKHFLRTG